jgi:hypothetical protein
VIVLFRDGILTKALSPEETDFSAKQIEAADLCARMIPEELYSTYSWYKKYTKTITTYSASKGQQCGYQLESFREKIKESIRVTYSFRHRHPWPLSKSTTGCVAGWTDRFTAW